MLFNHLIINHRFWPCFYCKFHAKTWPKSMVSVPSSATSRWRSASARFEVQPNTRKTREMLVSAIYALYVCMYIYISYTYIRIFLNYGLINLTVSFAQASHIATWQMLQMVQKAAQLRPGGSQVQRKPKSETWKKQRHVGKRRNTCRKTWEHVGTMREK